ncbi:MAG TPA: exonuclease SbcCD subunit D [Chloroflexota bacterium]
MRCHFVHAADIHLGYEQYNLAKRANDFARAYLAMVQYAVEHEVDFVLVAGDLFHRANADAWTLKQATAGLSMLRDAGIPVVTIEGNHDVQHYRKNLSWLEYLCDQELLILLNVQVESNGLKRLVPFDPGERRGSYVDLAGVRIYGIKYYGAMLPRVLVDVGPDLLPGPEGYTVLMLHTGLEGQVPHMHGGLSHGQIQPLHPPVDYLALGHVHKRLYNEYDWVFNPGSLETNSFEEIEWPHGFFDVTVNTAIEPKHVVQEIATPGLRPFRRISVSAEGCVSLEEFVGRAQDRIASARGVPEEAVLELHLGGVAEFRRQDVPLEQLKGALEVRFSPLTVRVKSALIPPGIVNASRDRSMSRAELERSVVEQLVFQHAEYRDRAAAWAKLIVEVKNMAVERDLPASIADHIGSTLSRLVAPDKDETVTQEPSPDGDPSPALEEP